MLLLLGFPSAMKLSESESCSVLSDSLRPHELYSPWNSPGQNTTVSSRSLLKGIFPTQGSNPGFLHCGRIFYQLSHQGSPYSRTLLFIHSIYNSLHLLIPNSQSFPPPAPTRSNHKSVLFTKTINSIVHHRSPSLVSASLQEHKVLYPFSRTGCFKDIRKFSNQKT